MAGLGWENAARDARDRDRVCELAPVDFAAACGVASGIRLPWYRVQAISGLAGAAPESQVDAFLEQARGEAAKDDDAYRRCGVMAWVIDAAIARGRTVFARDVLRRAIEGSAEATPTRSRATALELLLKRAAVLGEREAREAGEALLDAAEVLLADPFKKWKKWGVTVANRLAWTLGPTHAQLARELLTARFGAERAEGILSRHGRLG